MFLIWQFISHDKIFWNLLKKLSHQKTIKMMYCFWREGCSINFNIFKIGNNPLAMRQEYKKNWTDDV
jgi:hypothetical protein